AASLSLLAAGCGANSTAGSSSQPQAGGTAVIALPEQTSPNWFFPLMSLSADSTLNGQIVDLSYMPLLYYGQNGQLSHTYGISSDVTYNKAGTQFTVHLNPKWHWSNGKPVTAADVIFAYDIMKAGSNPNVNYAWGYAGQGSGGLPTDWKSVQAKGPDTVVITTTQPVNQQWFIRNGIGQIYPIPKSVWDKYPNNMKAEMSFINRVSNSPSNPVYHVVDGAWKFQSMAANQDWTFVPNAQFDGHKALLNKLVFQYETSASAEFEALKSGTVNYGYLPTSLLGDTKQLPNDVLTPEYSLGFNYIQLNMNPSAPGGIGKAFDELAVRQALQMGVDQAGIIKTILHGYGAVDDTTLASNPSDPFLDPQLATQPYPYNPTKGRQILEKAGWRMVNGVMTKNGIKLEFTMYAASGSNSYNNIDQLLQQDWAKEGIVAHIAYQPFDTVISYGTSDASKWQVLNWNGGWGYTSGYPSGGNLFLTGAAENSGGYSSSTMDSLINATYKPSPYQQTLQNMYAYEDFAAKQLPSVIYIPQIPTYTVHAKNLHNSIKTFNQIGGWIFPNEWWISK
ncbi:MAG: peptide ABC transporter substrate-binding protein, partial [Firmicutes bacterium]|nr:peptide ABC transporter substrate-binding protein [Bacillota bacterium]